MKIRVRKRHRYIDTFIACLASQGRILVGHNRYTKQTR